MLFLFLFGAGVGYSKGIFRAGKSLYMAFFSSQGISGLEDRPTRYGLWPDLKWGNGEKEEGSLSHFPPNLTLQTGPVHLGQRDTGFTKENKMVTPRASRVDRRRGLKRGSSNHSSSRRLFTATLVWCLSVPAK